VRARLATFATLIALVGTSVVVAGCGATIDPVAQAATRTSDVSTLRFTVSMKVQMPTVGTPVSLTATGAIDSAAQRLELSMDLSKVAVLSGEQGALGRMTIVEDGLVMYMSGGGMSRVLPGGKTWLRVDLSRAASSLGLDLSSLTGGQTDPRTSLAQLREAGNVVEIGPRTVKGVATTRYSVLIDLRQGLDKLDAASRKAMEQLVDRLESSGGRYVPGDAWIDADGYLRRFRMAIPNYLGTGTSFAMTMDLYDFGDQVSIDVPQDWQVADVTDRLSQALGG
jgi:hypothetical protein